jgi:LemA protein
MIGIIVAVIVVFFVIWFAAAYNGFIKLENMVKEGWSGINVQLKRRYDLIPNIIETVKGYAKHEEGLFVKVTEQRSAALKAESPAEKSQAENMLTSTLRTVFAVAENYPELKANENFKHLQQVLTEVEEIIQKSRRYYNGTVRDFNIKCKSFPSVIIANMFGFKEKEFFEIEDSEKENVKVSF